MAGKHFPTAGVTNRLISTLTRSPILILTASFFLISILFFIFSSPSSTDPHHTTHFPNPSRFETSFVAALDKFLASKTSINIHDDTVSVLDNADVKKLDDSMREREDERLFGDPLFPTSFPIRVYVYEMPRRFTYDLLKLFRDTYRETSNLTSNGSPVHRLIEQHSIDYWLWADLIAPESKRLLKTVVRVKRQEDADLFYVPFFTTISFFLLEKQECKALYRV